jgi:DNA-binding NarL/FixJ family response regulator
MTKKRARRVAAAPAVPARMAGVTTLAAESAAFVYAEPARISGGRGRTGPPPASAAETIPVFLIEDNGLVRDGITAMLAGHDITVIGTARSAKEALQQVRLLQRHVVLLDAAIKDADSLALVAAVRAASKHVSVVVMDLLPTHQDLGAFVRAGVAGFIMKDATEEVFVGTIRAVAGGAHVLPLPVNGAFLAQVAEKVRAQGPRGVRAAVRMTKREREVVAMVAAGASNSEIAARLHVAVHAVKSHVLSIMEKLALHTRLQDAARASAPSRRRIS